MEKTAIKGKNIKKTKRAFEMGKNFYADLTKVVLR